MVNQGLYTKISLVPVSNSKVFTSASCVAKRTSIMQSAFGNGSAYNFNVDRALKCRLPYAIGAKSTWAESTQSV